MGPLGHCLPTLPYLLIYQPQLRGFPGYFFFSPLFRNKSCCSRGLCEALQERLLRG